MEKLFKKKHFKLMNVFLTLFMIFSCVVPVHANTEPRTIKGTLKVDMSVGWKLAGTSWGTEGLKTINGEVVYCLQRNKTYHHGTKYTGYQGENEFKRAGISESKAHELSLIAYFGKQRAIKSKNKDWYAVTGSAIWALTGQGGGWVLSKTFNTEKKVKNGIKTLQNDVKQYYVKPSFNKSINNIKVGETIRLTDKNKVLNTYKIVATDGLKARIEGNDLVITGTSNAKENAIIDFKKNIASEDTGTSILFDAGSKVQKLGGFYVEDPIGGYVKFDVKKQGNLNIAKKDNKGNFVPNTSFKLSYSKDMSDPIGTYTTGSNGTVTVSHLEPSTVYVQETSVPNHLILDSTIHSVEIKANETASYTATNDWKQGYIQVVKKDKKTGAVVKKAGTEFEVLSNGEVVATITTNEKGVAKTGLLDYGTYTIREKKAPQNYVIATLEKNQGITENNKTYSIDIYNEPVLGEIELLKQDKETGSQSQGDASLLGAEYTLKANQDVLNPADGFVLFKAGEVISQKTVGNGVWGDTGTKTIDGSLKTKWVNLPTGSYRIEETKAPTGYLLDPAEHIVTITSSNSTTHVVKVNETSLEQVKKGQFEVLKTGFDGETGVVKNGIRQSGIVHGLANVEFTMKLKSDVAKNGWDKAKTYDVLTTDVEGRAKSKLVPYGIYQIKETKTPANYYPSGDFFINIDEDKKIEYRTVNNAPFKAWLKIVKTDEDGNKVTLSNATFKLKDSKGNYIKQKVGLFYKDEWKTDENGYVVIDEMLHADEYTIEEVKAPNGFLLANSVKVNVSMDNPNSSLDEDGQPVFEIKITDKKPVGNIILHKEFENDDDTALGGAIFKVTANSDIINPTDGSVIYHKGDIVNVGIATDGIYRINESGTLELRELPLGTIGASYKVEEIKTVDGYILLDQPVIFDFSIQDNTTQEYTVEKTVQNKLSETYFSKQNLHGEEIKDGEYTVIDVETHKVVDQWKSDGTVHTIKGLVIGKDYIFRENLAPAGYTLAQDIIFTMSENKQTIVMKDTIVDVLKLDENKQYVQGATLQVVSEKTKEIVDQWVTDDTSHKVVGLQVGESYILKEVKTPTGYTTAKDIQFTVKENEDMTITMIDENILTDIQVNKVDSQTMQTIKSKDFEFTLYSDKECQNVLKVVHANQEDGTATFKDLKFGTYYIKETKAPLGYQLSNEVKEIVINNELEGVGDVHRFEYLNKKLSKIIQTGDMTKAMFIFSLLNLSIIGIIGLKRKVK